MINIFYFKIYIHIYIYIYIYKSYKNILIEKDKILKVLIHNMSKCKIAFKILSFSYHYCMNVYYEESSCCGRSKITNFKKN